VTSSTRRSVLVQGKVQGVLFRHAAAQVAEAHDVTGFVRNERDGTVRLELEGRPDQVQAVIEWCRAGPPRARVSSVEVAELASALVPVPAEAVVAQQAAVRAWASSGEG
jgi:acylphosphatase